MIDLARVRADTPGIAHRIHLNNAGAALMPKPVVDAMLAYLKRESEIGGYETAAENETQLGAVYTSIAQLRTGG